MTTFVPRLAPLFVIATLVLGWFADASMAAGPPRTGSGAGMITSVDRLSERQVGPNRIQERTLEDVIQGALEGTFVQHTRGVIDQNGVVTFQATLAFTGTVEGCGDGEGTLTANAGWSRPGGQPCSREAWTAVLGQVRGDG